MTNTKSLSDYETSIKTEHNELLRLPPEHPDYDKIKDKLSRQLTGWANLLNISVGVASNEQRPYTSVELGLPCRPMALKKDTQCNQVADYQAYLNDYNQFAGIVIERKTLNDFYGSLMNSDHRSRLYREIARYEDDKRFNKFVVFAECSYEDFLSYIPNIFICQFDAIPGPGATNLIKYLSKYYKIENVSPKQIYKTDVNIFVSCEKHIVIKLEKNGTASMLFDNELIDTLYIKNRYGKRNLYQKKGATEVSKIETINSLENKVQISFVGSRGRAVQKYAGLIRQWCRRNYKTILEIEE